MVLLMKILYLYKTEELRHALVDLIMDNHPFSTYRAAHNGISISINDSLELRIMKIPHNFDTLRGYCYDYVYFENTDLTQEQYHRLLYVVRHKEGHVKVITSLDRPALSVCIENLK